MNGLWNLTQKTVYTIPLRQLATNIVGMHEAGWKFKYGRLDMLVISIRLWLASAFFYNLDITPPVPKRAIAPDGREMSFIVGMAEFVTGSPIK